jgi:HEAT repeat protein
MMSPYPQNPEAADQDVEQEAAAEKVRRVFSCLSKLVLGRKIYARNNPTLLRFTGELTEALGEFFREEDVLVVSIDKHEIRWNDIVVYHNDKRDESIAFILYKDGVGELSIRKSVTQDEIGRFVDLAKDAVRTSSQDDDIVTQLWRAEFEHISYRVLDEYLVGQFGDGRPDRQSNLASLEQEDHPDTPGARDSGRVIVNGKDDIEPLDTYLARLVGRHGPGASEEEGEERFQGMMAAFFTVSSEELRAFKERLFEAKRKDPVVGFIAEYLDFALSTEFSDLSKDVLGVVERLADYLILELRGPVLAALLGEVRVHRAKHQDSPQIRSFIDGLEKKLTDRSLLVSLGETVHSSEEEAEEAFAYFERVGEAAVPVICKLVEEDSDARLHKRARATLVRTAGAKLPDVIGRLNIDKPQVARDVIALTKAARLPEIPQVIRELVYYPDDHVRHEAIQFLASFGSDQAFAVLVKLLDDADKGIRLKTLGVVSGVDASVVRDKLVAIAFGKEFTEREFDEQMEIFKALGRVVGEDALPRLKQSVGKKNFLGFAKRHSKENKLLAIEALEQMDEPGAIRLLEDLARDSDENVCTRASEALRRSLSADELAE